MREMLLKLYSMSGKDVMYCGRPISSEVQKNFLRFRKKFEKSKLAKSLGKFSKASATVHIFLQLPSSRQSTYK